MHSNTFPQRTAQTSTLIGHLLRIVPLLLMSTLLMGYQGVSANGGATLISSQEQGAYRIDVSMSPGQSIVGTNHVSVLIVDLARDKPVTVATVNIFAAGPAGSTGIGPIPAPNDFSPQFFETNLPFDMQGDWRLTVEIVAANGNETVTVPLAVTEGGRINLIILAVIAVATLTVVIWTWDRIKAGRSKVNV